MPNSSSTMIVQYDIYCMRLGCNMRYIAHILTLPRAVCDELPGVVGADAAGVCGFSWMPSSNFTECNMI